MELKHYFCNGSCKGISQNPGICQSENCGKYHQELTECTCNDGLHSSLVKKKKNIFKKIIKILFFIIFTPVVFSGLLIAYFQIKSDGIDDLLLPIMRSGADFNGKIKDLLLREGNYVCSFKDSGHEGSDYYGYDGVAYISGINAVVEIVTPNYMGGSLSASRFVKKDDYLYRFGFSKTFMNNGLFLPKNIEKEKFNFIDKVFFSETAYLDQSHKFQCKKWKPDESFFDIPKDLENLEIKDQSTIKKDFIVAKQNSELSFARCVKDSGAVMYGAFWCEQCNSQKELFGSGKDLVPYVECSTPDGRDQNQICKDKKIVSYPYWVFPYGSSDSGRISLNQISQKTGCILE